MASFFRSEVDLFSTPATDEAVISSDYQAFYTSTSIDNTQIKGSEIEFEINGNGVRYLDPFESFIYFKVKVTNVDGTALADTDVVAPGNLFLHTMFTTCNVELNGTAIGKSNVLHAYHSWIRTLLAYGGEVKDSEMTASLYYKDTSPDEYDPTKNPSFKTRMDFAKGSATFEVLGKLCDGIFTQKRYLPPNCRLRITLRRSSPKFALSCADATKKYTIKIEQAIFYMRTHLLNPEISHQHLHQIENGEKFIYPIRDVQMKSMALPIRSMGASDVIFTGVLPEILAIGLVAGDAYQGKLNKNPFNFDPYGLSSITVMADNEVVGYGELEFDYAKSQFLMGFNTLMKAAQYSFLGNGLSREDFVKGNAIYVFDRLLLGSGSAVFNDNKNGQLRVSMKFATPLIQPLYAIIYGQLD